MKAQTEIIATGLTVLVLAAVMSAVLAVAQPSATPSGPGASSDAPAEAAEPEWDVPKDTHYYTILIAEKATPEQIDILKLIEFQEDESVRLSEQYYVEPFNKILQDQRNKCIADREVMNKDEFLQLMTMQNFRMLTLAHAVCGQIKAPESKSCSFRDIAGKVSDVKKQDKIPRNKPAAGYEQKGREVFDGFDQDCEKEFFLMQLMRGVEQVDGKPLETYFCTRLRDQKAKVGAGCEESLALLKKALADGDPAVCAQFEKSEFGSSGLLQMCRVAAGDDVSLCSQPTDAPPADIQACTARYAAYKAVKTNDLSYLDDPAFKSFMLIDPATRVHFNSKACQSFRDDTMQKHFCDWKYNPQQYDVYAYYKSDIEYARQVRKQRNASGAPEGGGK